MNRKGFTLTELMVVIAIIAIIILMVVPSILAINRNMNTRMYNNKKESMLVAAELYASNNPDIFNGRTEVEVYISDLLSSNYVSADLKDSSTCNGDGCVINPVDKSSMNADCVIVKKQAVGISTEYVVGCRDINVEEIGGTLVEQACKRFNSGIIVGKYDTGSNDYCGCKFSGNEVTGIYRATKNADGTLNVSNTSVNACIISGDEVNNYLKYDNVMWRVMGVYNIYNDQSKLVAKIITNDIIDD